MNERLKEIRKHMEMNQTDFANLLGIGQSTLAMMEVSKRDISDRHIKTICAICGVNENWFRTGKGDMLVEHGDSIAAFAAEIGLNEFQENLVRIVAGLPVEYQKMILNLANQISSDQVFETKSERDTRIALEAIDDYDRQQAEKENEA